MQQARSRRWISSWVASTLAAVLIAVLPAAPAAATVVKGTVTYRGAPLPEEIPSGQAVVILHGAKTAPPAATRAVINQRERRFEPRVLVVAAGTTVEFPNNDRVHHNVYSRSSGNRFDLGLYAPGETRTTVLGSPGIVELHCSAHSKMHAYVVVTDSPYFSGVSGENTYEIDGVAPGTYEAEIWHPDAVPVRRHVTIGTDIPVLHIDFDLRERRHAH